MMGLGEAFLVFSKEVWIKACELGYYSFTKEQIEAADKLDCKFIGKENNVKCYITPIFNKC